MIFEKKKMLRSDTFNNLIKKLPLSQTSEGAVSYYTLYYQQLRIARYQLNLKLD